MPEKKDEYTAEEPWGYGEDVWRRKPAPVGRVLREADDELPEWEKRVLRTPTPPFSDLEVWVR